MRTRRSTTWRPPASSIRRSPTRSPASPPQPTPAPRSPDAKARPERLAGFIEQNRGELRNFPVLFAPAEVETLARASRAALRRHERLLRERGEAGLVRRGHGDLHLGNIALIDGKPMPFDAIEFDPLIAAGDVLYDLAFLLMDLIERRLDAAANVVLNRYLAQTRRAEDLDGLAALPLFSRRAAIRAKVTAAKVALKNAAKNDADDAEAARNYFRLALRLIAPPPAVLLAIGGLSGSGKSTLARMLAPVLPPAPGAVLLRSDVERKILLGAAETERLPESGLHARGDPARLRSARRQGAPRDGGRSARDPRCGVRPPGRARAGRRGGAREPCRFPRALSHRDRSTARVARVSSPQPPDVSDADASRRARAGAMTAARWTGPRSARPARLTRRWRRRKPR